MKHFWVRCSLFLLIVLLAALPLAAQDATPEADGGGITLFASLSGAQEVPDPGDEDGTGWAYVTVNRDSGELCYTLMAENITLPAAAAHIHVGAMGEAGDVVIGFDSAPGDDGMAEGCVTAEAAALDSLLADPAGFYVNVHTEDFPGGALRGQLNPTTLVATLSGLEEVPEAGDEDGSGMAWVSIDPTSGELCYTLMAENITLPAAAAHIHSGTFGEAGDVLIGFDSAPGDDGMASGCVMAEPAAAASVLADPSSFYVNVHTEDFPGGAARGQLLNTTYLAALIGTDEVPGPGDEDGAGFASVTIYEGLVCYEFAVMGIGLPAAAAHIHTGAQGESGDVIVPFSVAPDENGGGAGCDIADSATLAMIAAASENFYVNVHTEEFPAGAVRGQLYNMTMMSMTPPDMGMGSMGYVVTLVGGAAEVPDGGDPDGSGSAILTPSADGTQLCYEVVAVDIALPATAMHIHVGAAGEAGDVVVPFPTAPDEMGLAGGCADVDPAVLEEIAANPAGFYLNVHNEEFPGGVVRGQLGE